MKEHIKCYLIYVILLLFSKELGSLILSKYIKLQILWKQKNVFSYTAILVNYYFTDQANTYTGTLQTRASNATGLCDNFDYRRFLQCSTSTVLFNLFASAEP